MVAFFKEEVRPEADGPEYEATVQRMRDIEFSMPGFISRTTLTTEDGHELTMVRRASTEALAAWRNHPEHLKAQKRGREFFHQSYSVLECSVIREIEFERDE